MASFAISVYFTPTAFAQETQRDGPQPPKIIRKSGGVLQGSATRRVEPAYPPLAKAARISGSVVVEVTIDEGGKVISARAISGHPLLKDTSVAAARGWRFSPTMLEGVPVKVIGTITFNFNLVTKEEIEALKEKVNASPSSAELHRELAELYKLDAQHEAAIAEYKLAVSLDPDYWEAYLGLGQTYDAAGQHENAVETYKQGLRVKDADLDELNMGLGSAYLNQGLAYLKQDRNEDALGAFKQAVAIDPDLVEGHYNLGLTYLKLGDKQSAMNEYNILKDLSEERAETLRRSINKSN